MRNYRINELASIMFAAYIWFTLTIAPNFFADAIASNPNSLYVGYIGMVGSQQNLAWISMGVVLIVFTSLFFENYNLRIMVNVISIVYFTFIAASYVINYPNLALGLLLVVIIWHIYETNILINLSEDEKAKKLLKSNIRTENSEGEKEDGTEETDYNYRSKD